MSPDRFLDVRRERCRTVMDGIGALVDGLGTSDEHRELLRLHLGIGGNQVSEDPTLSCVQVPAVFAQGLGVAGWEPLAMATTLVYLGADLLDNVADDELPTIWDGRTPAEANLAGVTFLAALVPVALARLDISAERREQIRRCFAEGMLVMSDGQLRDLTVDVESTQVCLALLERKSGAEFGVFALSAALLAGADEPAAGRAEEIGTSIGIARQLGSDLHDVWFGAGTDLLNGKRTLPVVHALTMLDDVGRKELLGALEAVRRGEEAIGECRTLMERAGSVRYVMLVIEVQRQRAIRLLDELSMATPYDEELRDLIDRASPLQSV